MFDKYQLVLLNPTPKWKFEDLHVDRKSGLPHSGIHQEMLANFCYCLARLTCNRRICTLGVNSSRMSRIVEEQLMGGCTRIYANKNSPKNGSQSLKLPEEIADIIVIAAHEPLDNLFSQIKL